MLAHCINTKSKEFKNLLNEIGGNPIKLAAQISKWQLENNVDTFPNSLDILKLESRELPGVREGLVDVFNENSELANSVYKAIGFNEVLTQQQKLQALQKYSQYLDTIFPNSKIPLVHKGFRNKKGLVHNTPNHSFYSPDFNIPSKWYRNEVGIKSYLFNINNIKEYQSPSNLHPSIIRKNEENFINNSKSDAVDLYTNDIGGQQTQYIIRKNIEFHELGSKQDIEGFQNYVKDLESRELSSNFVSSKFNYLRETASQNPDVLYIFTDNTDRTSGKTPNVTGKYAEKYGEGLSYGTERNPTTAVIRGLDNAFPISTMRYYSAKRFGDNKPHNLEKAKWQDEHLKEFQEVIEDEIAAIKEAWDSGQYKKVIIPKGDGFFNSKIADISKTRTPVLYEYLQNKIAELKSYVNKSVDTSTKQLSLFDQIHQEQETSAEPLINENYIKSLESDIVNNLEVPQVGEFGRIVIPHMNRALAHAASEHIKALKDLTIKDFLLENKTFKDTLIDEFESSIGHLYEARLNTPKAFTEEHINLIQKYLSSLRRVNSETWDSFINYYSSTYNISILDTADLTDLSFEELNPTWDDKKQFKQNNANSISARVKMDLSSVVNDSNTLTGLPEFLPLDYVINRLINAHINDSTSEDFINTLQEIQANEIPGLSNVLNNVISDPEYLALYKNSLNFDLAEVVAIIYSKNDKYRMFDIATSNRDSFVKNRDYDASIRDIKENIIRRKLSKLKSAKQYLYYTLRDTNSFDASIFSIVHSFKNPHLSPEELSKHKGKIDSNFFQDVADLAEYIGLKLEKVTLESEFSKYLNKYDKRGQATNKFKQDILSRIEYIFTDVLLNLDKGKSVELDVQGDTRFITSLNAKFSKTPTKLNYFNVNNDVVWTPIYSSMMSRLFKGLNSPFQILERFERFTIIPSFQYDNLLWNTTGQGMFNFLTDKNGIKSINYKNPVNKNFLKRFSYEFFNGIKDLDSRLGIEYDSITGNNWRIVDFLSVMQNKYHVHGGDTPRIASLSIDFGWDASLLDSSKDSGLEFDSEGVYVGIKTDSAVFKLLKNTILQQISDAKAVAESILDTEALKEGVLKEKAHLDKNKLHSPKHAKVDPLTGKVTILKNGELLGRVFSINNMEYRVLKDGKYVNVTFNDGLAHKYHFLFLDINDDVIQSAVNKHIQEALKEFMSATYADFSPLSNNLLNYVKHIKSRGRTSVDTLESNKLFKDKKSLNKNIARYFINGYLSKVIFGNHISGTRSEYASTNNYNKRSNQHIRNGNPLTSDKRFRSITAIDIILPSKITNLLNEFVKAHKDAYSDINTVDGITIATFKEFEGRMRDAGRYLDYKEIIDNINDPDAKFNPLEYNKLIESSKFFHYDRDISTRLDPNNPQLLSQQHKNSTIYINKKLAYNPEMLAIFNWMEANNIDQITFNSAAKLNDAPLVKLFDKDGRFISPKVKDSQIIEMNRSSLVVQLDVKAHALDSANKLAIQVMKETLNNVNAISNDSPYFINGKKYKGSQIKSIFHNNIIANIKDKSLSVLEEFGAIQDGEIQYVKDEDGENTSRIKVNKEKVLKYLRDYIIENVNSPQLMEVVKELDGDSAFPIYSSLTYKKFMAVLTSIFTNRIIKQELPGMHLTLVPEIGFNIPVNELSDIDAAIKKIEDNSSIVFTNAYKNQIRQDKEFKLKVYKKGDKIVSQLVVPAWFKRFYKNGELIDLNQLSPEVLETIGMRIPTEGKQSTVYGEIVGILKSGASQVIAPYELVGKTGWDFDIDTLYLYTKHLDKDFNAIKYLDTHNSDVKIRYETFIKNTPEAIAIKAKYARKLLDQYKKLTPISEDIQNNEDFAKSEYGQRLGELYEMRDVLYEAFSSLMGKEIENHLQLIDEINDEISELEESLGEQRLSIESLRLEKSEIFKNIDKLNKEIEQEISKNVKSKYKFDNFKKWRIEEQNIKQARDNMLIDIMSNVLSNVKHGSEYLKPNTYSNLQKISNLVNSLYGYNIDGLNPNNPLDLHKLRELNMSVRNLKGHSVAWDNIMKILGSLDTELGHIKYRVSSSDFVNIEALKNKKDLVKNISFDENTNSYIVTVSKFANSESLNWLDINGEEITNQSSEITSNILDAVNNLMGFNINDKTLSVFRLLTSNSMSYKYEGNNNRFVGAYLFTHQPIIVELTETHNTNLAKRINYKFKASAKEVKMKTQNELIMSLTERIYEKLTKGVVSNIKYDDNGSPIVSKKDIESHPAFKAAIENYERTKNRVFFPSQKSEHFSDFNNAYHQVLEDLGVREEFTNIIDTPESMIENIKTYNAIKEGTKLSDIDLAKYYAKQLNSLNTFIHLSTISEKIITAITTLNTDKLGAGPNISITRNLLNNISNLYVDINEVADIVLDSEIKDLISDYFRMRRVYDNTINPIERIKIIDEFLEETYLSYPHLPDARTSSITIKGQNIIEAIYPKLLNDNLDIYSGEYPIFQAFLFEGNLLAINAMEHLFPHETPEIYKTIHRILSPHGLMRNDYYNTRVINFINSIAISKNKFFNGSNNLAILNEAYSLAKANESNLNANIFNYPNGEMEKIFIFSERLDTEIIEDLNINIENPTLEDLKKFSSLPLANKIDLLRNSVKFKTEKEKFLGYHIIDLINEGKFPARDFKNKGYFDFNLLEGDIDNTMASINEMITTPGVYGKILRTTMEELIKHSFYLHGLSFGNNLSKYLDIKLLYEYDKENDSVIPMSTIADSLKKNIYDDNVSSPYTFDIFHKTNWADDLIVPEVDAVDSFLDVSFQTIGELNGKRIELEAVDNKIAGNQIIVSQKSNVLSSPYANNEYIKRRVSMGSYIDFILYRRISQKDSDVFFYIPVSRLLPFELNTTVSVIPRFNRFLDGIIFSPETYLESIDAYINKGDLYSIVQNIENKVEHKKTIEESKEKLKDLKSNPKVEVSEQRVNDVFESVFVKNKPYISLTSELESSILKYNNSNIKEGDILRLNSNNRNLNFKVDKVLNPILQTASLKSSNIVGIIDGQGSSTQRINIRKLAETLIGEDNNVTDLDYFGKSLSTIEGVAKIYLKSFQEGSSIAVLQTVNRIIENIGKENVEFILADEVNNKKLVHDLIEDGVEFRVLKGAIEGPISKYLKEYYNVKYSELGNKIVKLSPVLDYQSREIGVTINEFDGSKIELVSDLAKGSDLSIYLGDESSLLAKTLKNNSKYIGEDLTKSDIDIAKNISDKINSLKFIREVTILGDENLSLENINKVEKILRRVSRNIKTQMPNINTLNASGVSQVLRDYTGAPVNVFSHVNDKYKYTVPEFNSRELNLDYEPLKISDFGDIGYMSEQLNLISDSLTAIVKYRNQYKDVQLSYVNELHEVSNKIQYGTEFETLAKYDVKAMKKAMSYNLKVLTPMFDKVLELTEDLDKVFTSDGVPGYKYKNVANLIDLTPNERSNLAANVRHAMHLTHMFDFFDNIQEIDLNRGDKEKIESINEDIRELKALYEKAKPMFSKIRNYPKLYLSAIYIIQGKNPEFITSFGESIRAANESDGKVLDPSIINMSDTQLFEQYVKLLEENEAMSWSIMNLDSAFNTSIPLIDGVLKEYISIRGNMNQEVKAFVNKLNNIFLEYDGVGIDKGFFSSPSVASSEFATKFINNETGSLISEYEWDSYMANRQTLYDELSTIHNQLEAIQERKDFLIAERKRDVTKITENNEKVAKLNEERDKLKAFRKKGLLDWIKENQNMDESLITLSEKELKDLEFNKSVQDKYNFKRYLDSKRIIYIPSEERYIKIVPLEKYKSNHYAYVLNDKDRKFLNDLKELIGDITNEAYPSLIMPENFFPISYKRSLLSTIGQSIGNRGINTRVLEKGLMEEFKYEQEMKMTTHTQPYSKIRIDLKDAKESVEEYNERVVKEVNKRYKTSFETLQEIKDYNEAELKKAKDESLSKREYNPVTVMQEYIKEAFAYKHINQFENTLMILLDQLSKDEYKELKRSNSTRIVDKILSKIKGEKTYKTVSGKETTGQKRILEFLPSLYRVGNISSDFDRGLSILRGVTSLTYMGGNILGGIKNVSKGYIDEIMESKAGQFLNTKDLNWATAEYGKSLLDFMGSMGQEYTDNLIVSLMRENHDLLELRDSEEHLVTNKTNRHKIYQVFNNAVYFGMNATEHFMQYTMMLGMHKSHRVIAGKAVSFQQFQQDAREKVLLSMLNENRKQDYLKFKEIAQARKSRFNDYYDYFRFWTEGNITNAERAEISKQLKEIEIKQKEKFEQYETVFDQFELEASDGTRGKDGEIKGKASLKKDSKLSQQEYSDFINTVQKVNHTLHGVYNRIDRMALKNKAIFDLATQFRSWMKPNWDRYMGKKSNPFIFSLKNLGRSVFSEGLGTYQKGAYISLWDFIVTPIRVNNTRTDAESKGISAVFRILGDYLNFLGAARLNYNLLAPQEKSNITRALVNISAFTLSSVLLYALTKLALRKKDEDELESQWLSLLIYELNMIHSELTQFIPGFGWYGFYNRSKQYPLAAEKIIVDNYDLVKEMITYPFQSDEDRRYTRGIYKDRSRLNVLLHKNVPLLRQKHKWEQLPMYAGWYEMYNPLSIFFGK